MSVTVTLENAGALSLEGGITTFGQVFQSGDIASGQSLMAMIGGQLVPVQMDVKTRWEDGSVKHAIISLERPDIAAGSELAITLSAGTAPAQTAINMATASQSHSFLVDLNIEGKAPMKIDVMAALRSAIADGSADVWQSGAFASQARVELPIAGSSMRMVFDVTMFKGGGMSVDVMYNNDRAMEAIGGRVNYTTTITMDGEHIRTETVSQAQYQRWHTSVSTDTSDGGLGLGHPSEGWLNIKHDIDYMQETGAVPDYDTSITVSNTTLNNHFDWSGGVDGAKVDEPLQTYGVQPAMGMAGGRPDIGLTTQQNAAWLISQDIRAATAVLNQAEAASTAPWHYYDLAHDTVLNTENYPHVWADWRGTYAKPGDPNSTGLTQGPPGDTGWALAMSHQPNLSYVPYLMTGDRWMLDNLNSQASWSIHGQWGVREWTDKVTGEKHFAQLVNDTQIRAAAWSLREVDGAAFANPDGSAEKDYFASVMEENFDYILQHKDQWTAFQGEAYGWIPGLWQDRITPWQQDFLAMVFIEAANRGSEKALQVLDWMSNYLIGRFNAEELGYEMRDAASLNMRVGVSDPVTGKVVKWYTTWEEIGKGNEEWGWSNGNDDWGPSTNGYYPSLGLATLAGLHKLGFEGAKETYMAYLAERPPYTDLATYQKDPTQAIGIDDSISNPPEQIFPESKMPREVPSFIDIEGVPLSIHLSGDAAAGKNPHVAVSINGFEVYRGEVHSQRGSYDDILLAHVKPDQQYKITVRLLNDINYVEDRVIYVEDILVDGESTSTFNMITWQGKIENVIAVGNAPPIPEPAVPVYGAGADVLKIGLSGIAWKEFPKILLQVNGTQLAEVSIKAQKSLDQIEYIEVRGDFSTGAQKVSLVFYNDAYGGSAASDRTVFIHSLSLNGDDQERTGSLLRFGDTINFRFEDGAILPADAAPPPSTGGGGGGGGYIPPVPTTPGVYGKGANTLKVGLAGDHYGDRPAYNIFLDGKNIGSGLVSADNKKGQIEYIEIKGDFGADVAHKLVIQFYNDAWGGSADTDRNLHIKSLALDGFDLGLSKTLGSNGDAVFDFSMADIEQPPVEEPPVEEPPVEEPPVEEPPVENPPPVVEEILGTKFADVIPGTAADDIIMGRGGDDHIESYDGDDKVYGGAGNDTLSGGAGNDILAGGAGDDTLVGGTGNDRLVGGLGGDVLYGGGGNDILVGGEGKDRYVFANDAGKDYVRGFEVGEDILDFSQVSGLETFLQLTQVMHQVGKNTVIDLSLYTGVASEIVLTGIQMDKITADDVIV